MHAILFNLTRRIQENLQISEHTHDFTFSCINISNKAMQFTNYSAHKIQKSPGAISYACKLCTQYVPNIGYITWTNYVPYLTGNYVIFLFSINYITTLMFC